MVGTEIRDILDSATVTQGWDGQLGPCLGVGRRNTTMSLVETKLANECFSVSLS